MASISYRQYLMERYRRYLMSSASIGALAYMEMLRWREAQAKKKLVG